MNTWSVIKDAEKKFIDALLQEAGTEVCTDEEIKRNLLLKVEHTFKVREVAAAVAEAEGFDDELKICGSFCAVAHDFGRFEQFRRYRTFFDKKSVNHATFGVEIMKQRSLPAGVPAEMQDLLYRVVMRHNMPELPPITDTFEKNVSMLIRDADKVDILRVISMQYKDHKSRKNITYGLDMVPVISPAVRDLIESGKVVPYAELRTVPDFIVNVASWIRDIYFASAKKLFLASDFPAEAAEILADVPGGSSFLEKILHSHSM